MKYCLGLQLFFIFLYAYGQSSQNYISGAIIDGKTHKPIPYVTIYVNGTTIGCQSDEKGVFILKGLTFPCQVVCSHISYITKVIYVDGQTSQYKISLYIKDVILSGVTVAGKGTISKKQNISIFKSAFLGSDIWGRNAKLLNEDVLVFNRNQYGFFVEASTPLEVDLPLLGYRLKVDLISFQINHNKLYNSEQCLYTAYYYFIPLATETIKQADNILRNRLMAYYCSDLHFFRSLYDDCLSRNGYKINNEKVVEGKSIKKNAVMRKEYLKDENNLDYLRLTGYKDSSFVVYYYHKNGSPVNFEKMESNRRFVSRIFFNSDTCIIRSNGTIPDNSIMFDGKIGEKRVGSMLPGDYYPD